MTQYEQFCALARAAEVVGERWTLLILRELHLGPSRFSDLKARLEPIAPGVLNGRLRTLQQRGIIARRDIPPPTPARVYELTEAGRALQPALFELLRWGARYLFPMREGERFEPEWLRMVLEAYASPAPSAAVALAISVANPDGSTQGVAVVRGGPGGTAISPFGPAHATITGTPQALLGLMSGRLPAGAAVAQSLATVDGSLEAAEMLPALFIRPEN